MHDDMGATPIVLLSTENTPFAAYLGEILYTEGFPWFATVTSWSEAESLAGSADVLLVPAGEADPGVVTGWLQAGGTVVLIRPPADLADRAGLRALGRTVADAPLRLDAIPGTGVAYAHGDTDLYELKARECAKVLAHVCHDGREYPAIVWAPCEGGHVVVWAYDLPRSVALTRQGNPGWSDGRGTDFGSDTFRPVDLFVRDCGAQTWLDFPSAGTPFADLQQRLLAHLVADLARRPMPRLWYLPEAKPTVLTVLGDSDAASPGIISGQLDDVSAAGGCMSVFLIDYSIDSSSAEDVARWRAAGHEVSVHPDYALHADKSHPNADTMLVAQRTIIDRLRERFGFSPCTVRNHSICWVPYAKQAEIQRSLGIRLDSSFTYASAFAKPPYNGPVTGYLNGSGQPQKFADEWGRVLDIYQLGAQVCDEALKSTYMDLDAASAWRVTQALLDGSRQSWHSFVGLSFHPVTYHSNPAARTWLRDSILSYARRHGLPIWSSEQILHFADARRACSLERVAWSHGEYRCSFRAPVDGVGLTIMMPVATHGWRLERSMVGGQERYEQDWELAGGYWRCAVAQGARSELMARYVEKP